MSGSNVIPMRAVAAWRALGAALELAGTVPCTGRLQWISEAADERSFAAAHCRGCPVITACRIYADTAKEKAGVWGGRDRTPNKTRLAPPTIPMLFEVTECESSSALTPSANASNAI